MSSPQQRPDRPSNDTGGPPSLAKEPTPGEPTGSYTRPMSAQGRYPASPNDDEARYPASYPPVVETPYRTGQYDTSGSHAPSDLSPAPATDYQSVRTREKAAFGGIKAGAAFFGWLTSIGATFVLVAIVAAVASNVDLGSAVRGEVTSDRRIVAVVVVVVVLFLAYYCGGYVAGRMARFHGLRQGFAVWLWSILIAAVVTAVVAINGTDSQVAQDLDLPVARFDVDDLTRDSLIALGVVLGVSLVAAMLGGLAGMRFHRRVDRAGFDPDLDEA